MNILSGFGKSVIHISKNKPIYLWIPGVRYIFSIKIMEKEIKMLMKA